MYQENGEEIKPASCGVSGLLTKDRLPKIRMVLILLSGSTDRAYCESLLQPLLWLLRLWQLENLGHPALDSRSLFLLGLAIEAELNCWKGAGGLNGQR